MPKNPPLVKRRPLLKEQEDEDAAEDSSEATPKTDDG